MKNKIQINLGTDHALECTEKVIGRAGEGLVSRLEIPIPNALLDYDAYIDFEKPNDETLRTPKLEIENGVAYYDVPQYLLFESGEIKVQLVFIKGQSIWKSSKKRFTILKSINASDDIPEKEDFLTEAQKLIDELSQEVEEIADILANDAKFAQSVINACGGQTKITTINGIALKFFVGKQAEFDELSDLERQNLFAIITDDKTKEELFTAIRTLTEGVADNTTNITTVMNNRPHYLGGVVQDDARFINSSVFDINTLCTSASAGVYTIGANAMYATKKHLPSDFNVDDVTSFKLTVEATFDDSVTDHQQAVYQTIKASRFVSGHDVFQMYYRVYHGTGSDGVWDVWKQYASAEEVQAVKQELDEQVSQIYKFNPNDKTVSFPVGSVLMVEDRNGDHIYDRIGLSEVITPIDDTYIMAVGVDKSVSPSRITSDYVTFVDVSALDNTYSPARKLSGTWVLCGKAGLVASVAGDYFYLMRRVA